MKSTRHLAVALVVLAIGIAATLFLYSLPRQDAPHAPYTRLDGTPANIAELKGKVVLVNFWATTCGFCVREMPQLAATHQKFSDRGFETLAVAMSYDPPASVVNFAEARRLPFTVVIDNTGSVARAFGDVRATPTAVLIDKHGRIARRIVGVPDFEALRRQIDSLLLEA